MTRESALQLLEFVALTLPAVLLYMGVLYVILRATSHDRGSASGDGRAGRGHETGRRREPTEADAGTRPTPDDGRFPFWRTTALQQTDFALALTSLLLLASSALVLASSLWVPTDASLLVAQGLILLSFLALLLSFGATFYLSLVRSSELRAPDR